MTLKDIEKLNKAICDACCNEDMKPHMDKLKIFVVSDKKINGLQNCVRIICLEDFAKLLIDDLKIVNSVPQKDRITYAEVELERNGWAGFISNGDNNYIILSDPESISLWKKEALLPITRSFVHEFGHFKQKVLQGAYSGNNSNCTNVILEYHNIMFNENCSNEPLNKTNTHPFDGKVKRVAYSYSRSTIEKITEQEFEKAKLFIEQYCQKNTNKIDKQLITEMLNKDNKQDYDEALIYNLYKELEIQK